MMNQEIYEKDPRSHTLLNQGVAKVTSGQTDAELVTLRYELENFVCDGQYAEGLSRILSTYLGHLDKPEQPGVWVSGFFGSGKSHLVKMLQYLWTDFEFKNDGAKARGLPKNLPSGLKDLLKELSTSAKRLGGLHAAAGTLGAGAGESIRLELLGIIFKSVGLPEQYSRASFMIWLKDEGLEASVRDFIQQGGGDFDKELANLYVSDLIAKGILAARPEFASKPADVKTSLQKQFPKVSDVSIDEMIAKIKQAISQKGKVPCTIIILDEVQQYIADDVNRSKAVQDLQEHCCSRLGANLMFVATGQNALSGVPLLQRLQGRFPVTVELQDTDVEQVTRELVLKKKPSAEAGLKKLLDDHSGEIERQLVSTKIAFSSRDRRLLVQDYPILPVRRRFWERVLRAVDKAGTGAQLRTQLWIVYDAVKNTAEQPIGTVVNGAFLYEHIKTRVIQSGILLQEIAETIARQKQEVDGELRYHLCSLIFLIGQLPHQGPADAGVRADTDTLADLLVTDLTSSSAELRKKIPLLLDMLVTSGSIMRIDNEYRMQTREGSEWNQVYLEARNKLLNDPAKLASERSQLLRTQCSEILKTFKLLHGKKSKESRKIELHFGDTPPSTDGASIPVWIRDGWETELSTVLSEARMAGDAAIVYGHIPRTMAYELNQAIAGHYAATTTLQAKGAPSGEEGIHARKAMETLQTQSLGTRDGLITTILNETQVYLAGGDNMEGTLLNQKIEETAKLCLDRLYPLFHLADFSASDWEKVYTRAKGGAGDAMAAVDHKGDVNTHPVCKAVVDYVGSGRKGADIQKHFEAPAYGWPKDAINAVLVVLVHAGVVRAISASKESVPPAKLDQKTISTVEFRCETITLSTVQLIAIRGVFKAIGIPSQPGDESTHAPNFLNKLKLLAEAAGGDAPLPKVPSTVSITDLANRVGNDQLKGIFDSKDEFTKQIANWQRDRDLIAERSSKWTQLIALLKFAADLPVAAEVQPEVTAIEQGRKLLASPDPVPAMVEKLTNALRGALNQARDQFTADYDTRLTTLTESPTWKQIPQPNRHQILGSQGIRETPKIDVGTTEEVIETLQQTNLSVLSAIRDALPTRFQQAASAAAILLKPKAQSISLPGGTIENETELQVWLDDVKVRVMAKLKDGPVIL